MCRAQSVCGMEVQPGHGFTFGVHVGARMKLYTFDRGEMMKEKQESAAGAGGEPLPEDVGRAVATEQHQDDGRGGRCSKGSEREQEETRVTLIIEFQNGKYTFPTNRTTLMGNVKEAIAELLKKDVSRLAPFKCAGEEIGSNCLAEAFRGQDITIGEDLDKNLLDEKKIDIRFARAITRGGCEQDNNDLEALLLLPKVNVNKILDTQLGPLTPLHMCILYLNDEGLQMLLDHPKMSTATVNRELLCSREGESRIFLSPLRMAADLALGRSALFPVSARKQKEYGLKMVRLLLKHPGIKLTTTEGWSLFDYAR